MGIRKLLIKFGRNRKRLVFAVTTALCIYMFSPKNVSNNEDSSSYLPLKEGLKKGKGYSELYDPRSPNYGILRKNLYGFPLNEFGITSYDDDKLFSPGIHWKYFFAPLFDAMAIHKMTNPSSLNQNKVNSASVSINKNNFAEGTIFKATLQTYDKEGKKKFYGGDYFRIRLVSDSNSAYSNGVPCEVLDNEDGTYNIMAPLLEKGTFWLDIKLVLPLEGLYELLQTTKDLKTWSFEYDGTLKSGELVHCSVIVPSKDQLKKQVLCDYTNPTNMEPLFCTKPSSGNCTRVVHLENKSKETDFRVHEKFKELCRIHGCNTQIKSDISINVKPMEGAKLQVINSPNLCRDSFLNTSVRSNFSGYASNSRWVSLECQSELENAKITVSGCLHDKVIYFLGDQTLHQFFEKAASDLDLDVKAGPENVWHQPKVALSKPTRTGQNLTMYYRGHGLPFFGSGPPHSFPYISDVITDIQNGGENVYVILAMGYDFVSYDPATYISRLFKVRKSIETHHEKFPGTKFIVKGMHAVEEPFEWHLLRLELISREAFLDLNNVVYINLWEFSTLWCPKTIQPETKILEEQEKIILKYLC